MHVCTLITSFLWSLKASYMSGCDSTEMDQLGAEAIRRGEKPACVNEQTDEMWLHIKSLVFFPFFRMEVLYLNTFL